MVDLPDKLEDRITLMASAAYRDGYEQGVRDAAEQMRGMSYSGVAWRRILSLIGGVADDADAMLAARGKDTP